MRLEKLTAFRDREALKHQHDFEKSNQSFRLGFDLAVEKLLPMVRHSCGCPRSSCLRKVLSEDEWKLGCNCGAEEMLK